MSILNKALYIITLFFYWLTMPYWNWRENRIADRNAETWRKEFPPAWSMSLDEYEEWKNNLTPEDIRKIDEDWLNAVSDTFENIELK